MREVVDYGAVHRALLAGVPRQFGLWDKEAKAYRSASGGFFAVFPGSGVFGNSRRWEWVMGLELVETSRLWARRVARIEPEWLEVVAPHLCRSRYGEAMWDVGQGAVYGKESVICGGLVVVSGRRVHYGRVDKKVAHEVFLREGLLGGGLRRRPEFLERLDVLREEVRGIEEKLRRPGGLWSEDAVLRFYEERVPGEIHTAAAFHKWSEGNEGALMLRVGDVVWESLERLVGFPDVIFHEGEEYPVYYRCEAGERDDGVTMGVHVDQLPGFPGWLAGWGVDGNLEVRAELLMRALPKDFRRVCQPIGEVARGFAERWSGAPRDCGMGEALAEYIKERTGGVVPVNEFDERALPPEWVTKIWVCDDEGEELALGVDVAVLKLELAGRMRARFEAAANADVERRGMSVWDGECLPEEVMTAGGPAFPALVDEGGTVGVRAFTDLWEARESHRAGGARLLCLGSEREVEYLRKKFPLGMLAKVELVRLGVGGTTLEDLILLTAEGVAGGVFPRSPDGFRELVEKGRGRWFEVATEVGKAVDGVLEDLLGVREWIGKQRGDRNLGEVAVDLEEELEWLLRGRFAWRAGFGRMVDYPRRLRAMKVRLGRISSLPLIKDLEKMERVRRDWEPWFGGWQGEPERVELWEKGWELEDARVRLFAPDLARRR